MDALLRVLPKPTGACARYNLTLDALPLDMSSITADPVALSGTHEPSQDVSHQGKQDGFWSRNPFLL